MRFVNIRTLGVMLTLLAVAGTMHAQAAPADPSARLKEVLPPDVANRVLAVVAKARAHGLSGEALENRALKFAAKGVAPALIERSIADQEERMDRVRETLQLARGHRPSDDEIDAGAEAMRKGVDGSKVSALAKSAPTDRSLAVPLYVVGSLVDRGLPSDSALARVEAQLRQRASDRDLESIPSDLPAQAIEHGNRPAETGRALAETKHPGSAAGAGQSGGAAGGPPSSVPANGGAGAKPTTPPGLGKKPDTPPKKP